MKARGLVGLFLVLLIFIGNGCASMDHTPSPVPPLTWEVAPTFDLNSALGEEADPSPSTGLRPRLHRNRFEATAYCTAGVTASGQYTKRWMVAADPDVLPMGSRIAVHNAGDYSGLYTVTDTGALIKGHKIDIFMESEREALEFGRRDVEVELFLPPPAEALAKEFTPRAGVSVR